MSSHGTEVNRLIASILSVRASQFLLGTVATFSICFLTFSTLPAFAEKPSFVSVSVGAFDINDDTKAVEFRGEYRSNIKIWHFTPIFGLSGTDDKGIYGFSGLGMDLYFGQRIVLTPSASLVGYYKGDGKNLGGEFQFRTGGELAWRFNNWSRLGVGFHHISNAGIYNDNPGAEILALTYSLPFGTKSKK